MSKTGQPSSGSVLVHADSAAPFDCAPGPGTTTTTGPVTLTPLADDHNEDSAESLAVLGHADPCTDYEELGATAGLGGLRDPFNPYDFYDVNGDGIVTLTDDINVVISAFGATPGNPLYHPSKDRGALLGPNIWNREGPDGIVTITDDILVVINQFGHDCRPAPN